VIIKAFSGAAAGEAAGVAFGGLDGEGLRAEDSFVRMGALLYESGCVCQEPNDRKNNRSGAAANEPASELTRSFEVCGNSDALKMGI
jgi:hypothetical protein